MLMLSEADLTRTIDKSTLMRAEQINRRGDVLEADINASGTVIVGRVRESGHRPYEQMITLRASKAGTIVHGACSCKAKSKCVHIAAVLINAARKTSHFSEVAPASHANELQANTPHNSELSSDIKLWLKDLDDALNQDETDNAYPDDIKQRLIYVLDIQPSRIGGAPSAYIVPNVARIKKDGTFGTTVDTYTPSNILKPKTPKYLRHVDHDILHEMNFVTRRTKQNNAFKLRLGAHPLVARLFEKILKTGRCHLGTVHGPLLRYGDQLTADLHWLCEDETSGRQRLAIRPQQLPNESTATFDAVLPTSPPFYVKSEAGTAGPLDLGVPQGIAARLVEAPEVSPSDAAQLSALLGKRLSNTVIESRMPLPEPPQKTENREVKPIPRLELYEIDVSLKEPFSWYIDDPLKHDVFKLPLARLAFDYDGEIVPFETKSEVLERLDNDLLILTPRDARAELGAFEHLLEQGLAPVKGSPLEPVEEGTTYLCLASNEELVNPYLWLETFDDPARFIAFGTDVIPQLIAGGWQVAYAEGYPYQIADGEASWWADIGDGSGIDWFSFELGIEFEGERINLAPQLAELLMRMPPEVTELMASKVPEDVAQLDEISKSLNLHHKLEDGRLLPLPASRLMPVLKSLLELIGPRSDKLDDGSIKLHRAEASALANAAGILGQNVAWTASAERLVALGKDLKRGRSLKKITPPKSFKAELRPYQKRGLSWLDFLRETGFGGVLADDMGLGKTVQALAFLSREKIKKRLTKPALIIAPTSVLPNWQSEAQRFAPELKVLALKGSNRKRLFDEIVNHDLVLTTYPLLARDAGVLLEHEFYAAILDEAQAIKNPKANISKLAHALKADHRFALTGTPLENNLGEVWSLFQFLSPGLLGDEGTFRRTFRTPIEKHGCQTAQDFLTRRLKPFMLRRTKEKVAKELPPKTEIIERVRLEGAQRDLYETVRVLMHDKVRDEIAKKGLAKSHIVFLDALLKLRQICCDPRLLKMQQARKVKQSAKLERLMQMLPEMVEEGRRVLIFSQFTSMLSLIEKELSSRHIGYVQLTGKTKDRAVPVKAFQDGEVPVFLLSLKAGGTGLNLTAADTVIHYDPWWNPAVEAQATDRAYRIGQKKKVFVYKLMVEEGIEEAIELLKARKSALADALFAGASKSGLDLTEADISALFAPLEPEIKRKAA